MSRLVAVLAMVACVVLAGCGGPGTENETTTSPDWTRAVAVPPNETVANETTAPATTEPSRAAGFEADHPSLAGTDEQDGIYSPSGTDSSGVPNASESKR